MIDPNTRDPRLMAAFAFVAVLLFARSAQSVNVNRDVYTRPTNDTHSQLQQVLMEPNLDHMPVQTRVLQVNKDPKILVHSFYEYYLDGFPQIDDERVIFARYLTSRFFDEAVSADDYDVFLDAQDFDVTWKNNFVVGPALIRGNAAKVKVSLRGKTFTWALEVSVVKSRGVWKIDKVKGLNRS